MRNAEASNDGMGETLHLHHGSDMAIEQPLASLNTGFADLGTGFYLTDDYDVALARARSRARANGGHGVVSTFTFDAGAIPWVEASQAGEPQAAQRPFGLRFAGDAEGIAAWMDYIKACRAGETAVPGWGEPAVVRAWIATEEVEMVCSGLVSAEELAELINPADLTVQYCFRDQGLIDGHLHFLKATEA